MNFETVYRDVQVDQVATSLKLSKNVVENILTTYVAYLKKRLEEGETIKFLNVCYLRVNSKDESSHKTLAYVCTELGNTLGISSSVVYRVLTSFEECLISDLQNMYTYCIRGLINIRLEKNTKGEYRVRTKKSTIYNGDPIYVTTLGSFKRRVEIL